MMVPFTNMVSWRKIGVGGGVAGDDGLGGNAEFC